MKHFRKLALVFGIVAGTTTPLAAAQGFISGSTGADGIFAPSCTPTPCSVSHALPPNGILNFTTVTIPAGVTVTFTRNVTNTAVVMLATGNVTIAGTIDVSGGNSLSSNFGDPGDRSLPGLGGPGGFDGGRGGGIAVSTRAGNGLGPGAGTGGSLGAPGFSPTFPQGGGGGGYSAAGGANFVTNTSPGGAAYGSNLLVPLVGGSGGGSGSAQSAGLSGTGGGGGGGAILIASSGTVHLTGSILARGGSSGAAGNNANNAGSGTGGGGSGGAIRIVASNVIGAGTLSVVGGTGGIAGLQSQFGSSSGVNGGTGATGRTSVQVVPTGTLSINNTPALVITSVAGIAAPASPSGAGDVTVPESTPNPAAVNLMTTGVPPGGTVSLRLTPFRGASTTVISTPLTGSLASATASASIDIPTGISTLTASTSFTLTVAQGEALSQFAQNERVERVELVATYGGPQQAMLVTVSGKEYVVPAEMLRMAMLGG